MVAWAQALKPKLGVALQMLVAGLAADAELLAQVGHGKMPAARKHNESVDHFRRGYVLPGHLALIV